VSWTIAARPHEPEANRRQRVRPEDVILGWRRRRVSGLAARSEINSNPKDTKDYPKGVWALPPFYTLGDVDHAKYEAIGERRSDDTEVREALSSPRCLARARESKLVQPAQSVLREIPQDACRAALIARRIVQGLEDSRCARALSGRLASACAYGSGTPGRRLPCCLRDSAKVENARCSGKIVGPRTGCTCARSRSRAPGCCLAKVLLEHPQRLGVRVSRGR